MPYEKLGHFLPPDGSLKTRSPHPGEHILALELPPVHPVGAFGRQYWAYNYGVAQEKEDVRNQWSLSPPAPSPSCSPTSRAPPSCGRDTQGRCGRPSLVTTRSSKKP